MRVGFSLFFSVSLYINKFVEVNLLRYPDQHCNGSLQLSITTLKKFWPFVCMQGVQAIATVRIFLLIKINK